MLYNQDGRSSARYAAAAPSGGDDDRIIQNGFASNLRRAFPLTSDDTSADDRFRVLLDALAQIKAP